MSMQLTRIKSAIASLVGGGDTKSQIVSRLLNEKHITAEEAVTLLGKMELYISKIEMSSGAKIVGGDDNEVNYR